MKKNKNTKQVKEHTNINERKSNSRNNTIQSEKIRFKNADDIY